jgi:hypothetical protein
LIYKEVHRAADGDPLIPAVAELVVHIGWAELMIGGGYSPISVHLLLMRLQSIGD